MSVFASHMLPEEIFNTLRHYADCGSVPDDLLRDGLSRIAAYLDEYRASVDILNRRGIDSESDLDDLIDAADEHDEIVSSLAAANAKLRVRINALEKRAGLTLTNWAEVEISPKLDFSEYSLYGTVSLRS